MAVRQLPLLFLRVRAWTREIDSVSVNHVWTERPVGLPTPVEHELTSAAGEAGLQASGFEILARDSAFIDRAGDPNVWWMIVARRT